MWGGRGVRWPGRGRGRGQGLRRAHVRARRGGRTRACRRARPDGGRLRHVGRAGPRARHLRRQGHQGGDAARPLGHGSCQCPSRAGVHRRRTGSPRAVREGASRPGGTTSGRFPRRG